MKINFKKLKTRIYIAASVLAVLSIKYIANVGMTIWVNYSIERAVVGCAIELFIVWSCIEKEGD